MAEPGPVDRLIHRLRLDVGKDDEGASRTWVGHVGPGALNQAGRLFGGFLLGQTVMAAGLTCPGRRVNSLHYSFLRAGRADEPIDYLATPLFDGQTYASVSVLVRQSGEVIGQAQIGLTAGQAGVDRSEPPARNAVTVTESVNRHRHFGRDAPDGQPVEFRFDPDRDTAPDPALEVLFRANGHVGDDPLVHQALLAFASDRAFLSVAWKPHRESGQRLRGASLNHTIAFHRPVDMNDWHTHLIDSPSIVDGIGLIQGQIYNSDRQLVATVMQQGAVRAA